MKRLVVGACRSRSDDTTVGLKDSGIRHADRAYVGLDLAVISEGRV